MKFPEIPVNEPERIDAVKGYAILDTIPENDFDDITTLAAHICGTPISTISLVDSDRQWFKSHYGLAVNQTPRQYAFCAHAINQPLTPFIVNDSRADQRFADNPLVTGETCIVFYAGVPLVNSDGYALGTLSVMDHQPNELSEQQIAMLKSLANQVLKLLELRLKNIELNQGRGQLDRTLKLLQQTGAAAKVGGWEFCPEKNILIWTAETRAIYEVSGNYEPDFQATVNFFLPGRNRDAMHNYLSQAINTGTSFDAELQIVTAKGNIRWVRIKGQPETEHGVCKRIFGICQDVHEAKLKELKLQQSEEQFRKTFNHASIGMALVSPHGKWIKVNPRICEMFGYTEAELLQCSFKEITHPDDLAIDIEKSKELLAGKIASCEMQRRYFHRDGSIVWVILSVSLVRDDRQRPLHFIAQIVDITSIKAASQSVKEERALLNTIIDNLPLNVFAKDVNRRKTLVNLREMQHLNAASKEELIGKTDEELYTHHDAMQALDEDLGVLTTGRPLLNKETFYLRKDGKLACLLTSKIPLQNDEGKITGLVGIGYDITDRKNSEQQLQQLVKMTNEQNERLLNFAHIVSHNLRSHSSNFALLLEFLETETDEEQKEQLFAMLKKASGNLSDTVAHLNDVVSATSDANKDVQNINLNNAIALVQDNVKALLKQNNVEVINAVAETLHVAAVPAYLDSILLNFLTNGIKYRSADRKSFVRFEASQTNDHILLSIKDNGLGIDLEKNNGKIFGMYKTFHGNKDARGVGLFITKNQVEAMGGRIEVESKINEGTTFHVYFSEKKM